MSRIQGLVDRAGEHDEDLDGNVFWAHDDLVQDREFRWEFGTVTTLSAWGLGVSLTTDPAWGEREPNTAVLDVHVGPWHLYLKHAWERDEAQRG